MKQFLTLLLLCWSTALLFSQENSAPPAKKPAPPVPKYVLDGPDPLGRPYHPTVGILPAVATIPMPSDVLNYMGISFVNGMSLNALLPFGAVNKAKFDSMSDILEGLTPAELKKYYYWESVGVEYLARLEVNQYAMLVDKDTVWDNVVAKQFHMKDVYNGFAHVTVSIFDVSTSNLLFTNSFSANGSSRNPPVTPLKYGQPDSLIALGQMYNTIKESCASYGPLLAGVGMVDSILEIKKDRAKTVRLNPNKLLNFAKIGSSFRVYAMDTLFSINGNQYRYSPLIAQIYKGSDYKYWEMNFEVTHGEKDLLEAFQAGKKLVAYEGNLPLSNFPLNSQIPTVLMDTFQSKAKATPRFNTMLQNELLDGLSLYPQFFKMVNRACYHDLEIERRIQARTHSDASQAGITAGAEYLLTGEVLEYNYKHEPITKQEEIVEQPKPATPAPAPTASNVKNVEQKKDKTSGTAAQNNPAPAPAKQPAVAKPKIVLTREVVVGDKAIATAKIELRLVSIKTGEIIWSKQVSATGSKEYPLLTKNPSNIVRQMEVSQILAQNLKIGHTLRVAQYFVQKMPILKILDMGKSDIDLILVGGGSTAGINYYSEAEVVEESTEMVDNQALKRETTVAELRLKEYNSETGAWKVRKGGKALKERIDAKANLFVRMTKL